MRKKIQLTSAQFENNNLLFTINSDISFKTLEATGQMLVDSSAASFVYIIEMDEEYTYLELPEEVWPQIKKALDLKAPISILHNDQNIELVNIHEEWQYLIENIKGNSNYGEEMVKKVESVF